MKQGYEIEVYQNEWRHQVIDVLQHLWGADRAENEDYFEWKYLQNPFVSSPLGIVARHDGRMVGFRGYFPIRCGIEGVCDDILLLCPGDTCVHPLHRRQGLSVKMGYLAMERFLGSYNLFLNTTTTRNSLPGYRKLGFLPLAKKIYLSHYDLLSFLRYVRHYEDPAESPAVRTLCGQYGSIAVSGRPRPAEMASLLAARPAPEGKIRLNQNADFFEWRFRNPRKRYVFCHDEAEPPLRGYLVLGLSPNRRRAYVLDYAGKDLSACRTLLRFITQSRFFDIVSIYPFGHTPEFSALLAELGFRRHGVLRFVERRKTGELPLLIRPVKRKFAENDLWIHGLDIRNPGNWQFRGVWSDDA